MFISGHTKTARAQNMLVLANEQLEKFLAVNPSRRDRAFIRVRYEGSRYVARYGFTSDQGTSTVGTVHE